MRTYRTLALVGTFIKIIGWLFIDLSTSSQRSVQLLERLARAPFPPQAPMAGPAPLPTPGPNPPQPYGTQ